MKKILSFMLVLALLIPMLVACSPAAEPTKAPEAPEAAQAPEAAAGEVSLADEIFPDIEPLETPTELTFGQLSDSQHGFVSYFLYQINAYEKVGITPKFVVFGNGPVMVEALPANSWDCGTYGIGGILAGTVGHGTYILGGATYDNGLWIFAKKDSDIVKAGTNVPESPELYGTAETWKGKDIYLPTGTTLHYALVVALDKFGLTSDDVKMTHMDVPTVNTTLLSGQGEIGGVWSNFVFSEALHKDYMPVIKPQDVKADMITAYVANPRSYEDPVKKQAIIKWVEMYETVVDWLYDGGDTLNEEKLDVFVGYYKEWNELNGIKSEKDELKKLCHISPYISLKQNYDLFHTEVDTEDGKMSQLEELNYNVLKFFVGLGNYQPDSIEKMLNNTHNSEAIDIIYENLGK
jgi:sulfonate transport system substrate-binding protein